jgi:Ca2+-binding RTX toxin-like protein
MATITGTPGSDGEVGTPDNDVIRGLGGDDGLLGLGADDVLDGGSGDDSLFGGEGQDYYIGGRGRDGISYAGAVGAITVDLRFQNRAVDTGGDGIEWLSSIEGVTGADFDDVLSGDNGSNVLGGDDGDDLLTGRDGGDILYPTNDFNGAVSGDDTADGGAGRDAVVIGQGTAPVSASLLVQGTAQDTGVGMLTLIDVEMLFAAGHASDDTFVGDAGNNTLGGGWGEDLLQGGDGPDVLWGAGWARGFELTAEGGEFFDGADTLEGGAGADILVGSRGSDRLVGGTASDRFVFVGSDVVAGNAGAVDLIVDLEAKDWIDLSAIDADAVTAGDQAFVVVAAFSGAAGEARIRYNGTSDSTRIDLNTDADADIEAAIRIAGDHTDHANLVL